jgi:hypothetical protein
VTLHTLSTGTLRRTRTRPGGPVGYDVVIIAGQSNATDAGGPYVVGLDDLTYPRIKAWPGQGAEVGSIVPAKSPLGGQSPNVVSTLVGIGMGFARAYIETVPANRSVLLVPVGVGGTALVSGPWAVGGTHYLGTISKANAAIAAAGADVRVKAILWMQGEADSVNSRTQAQYAAALDAAMGGYRANITGATNMKVVVGPMVTEWRTAPHGNSTQIHAAHVATPGRLTNSFFVDGPGTGYGMNPNDPPPGDNIHWNAEAMRFIGAAMAEAIT